MRNLTSAILLACVAAACGSVDQLTGRQPIVDMQGVNVAAYQADLWDCQRYADQVKLGQQVAVAATTGAVAGAAVGASVGNSDKAERLAGVGAVAGSVKGAARALNERQRVLGNCLSGRGYRVLN